MFPVQITVTNIAQLNAVMAALNVAGIEPAKIPPCVGHAAETVKEEAKAEAAETTQAAEQKPETLPQIAVGEVEKAAMHSPANNPADAPTYQATAAAVTKLAREKGRDAAIVVLTKFGAAKLPDIQPNDFQKVIDACAEAMQ